jgi:hypothetical protein
MTAHYIELALVMSSGASFLIAYLIDAARIARRHHKEQS